MNQLNVRTILVVDDEQEIRDIIESFLEPLGVTILKAGDGQEALNILQNQQVQAILTDVSMPRMTGLELMAEVRLKFPEIPLVLITALSDTQTIKEGLRLGAFDFIDKPFCEEEMISIVTRAIETGVRRKNLHDLSRAVAVGEDGENARVAKIEKEKRMIGLLAVKNNMDKKKAC